MSARRVRVLVVDDSAFMRRMVASAIEEDSSLSVVGYARDGREAVEKVVALKPDVVTLDVEMPGLNGFEALAEIMAKRPTPVLMLSSLTKEGAEATIRCLELGAFDFLAKPVVAVPTELSGLSTELVAKIHAASRSGVGTDRPRAAIPVPGARRSLSLRPQCVFVASSTGGPRALQSLFSRLRGDLGVPVVVVQHMPAGFTRALAARLDSASALTVVEAENGQVLRPNTAYLAPGWCHMEVTAAHRVEIVGGPSVNGVKPSADVTLHSMCDTYGGAVCGVVLTGMGKDGAEALKRLHDLGGRTIAESEESCVVYGMPRAAVACGAAELVLHLDHIPTEIERCVHPDAARASA